MLESERRLQDSVILTGNLVVAEFRSEGKLNKRYSQSVAVVAAHSKRTKMPFDLRMTMVESVENHP